MKPYGQITNRTFYNDRWGKVKTIPSSRVRNQMLKSGFNSSDMVEVQLPIIKSRTTLKRQWKNESIIY